MVESSAPALSLPKVLHYLQHEWRSHAAERNAWALERAQLTAKVAVLEGEKRAAERAAADLLQRVRLLEHALRRERIKALGGQGSINGGSVSLTSHTEIASVVTISSTGPTLPPSSTLQRPDSQAKSRQVLLAYLEEASALARSDLYLPPVASDLPLSNEDEVNENDAQRAAHRAREQHIHESGPRPSPPMGSAKDENGDLDVPSTILDDAQTMPDRDRRRILRRSRKESMSRPQSDTSDATSVATEAVFAISDAESPASGSQAPWKLRHTLRHHVDAVRQVAMHPREPLLATASEDGTVKLWSLMGAKKRDLEPIITLRAHTNPVLSVAFDCTGEVLFSGGTHSDIFAWRVPAEKSLYAPYDPRTRAGELSSHTQAVWDLASHPLRPLLASVSADDKLIIWDTQLSNDPLVHKFFLEHTPTSCAWVTADLTKLAVSDIQGGVSLLDAETGTVLARSRPASGSFCPRVVAHPTDLLLASAHDSGDVCLLDPRVPLALVKQWRAHPGPCSSVTLTDRYAATSAHDGAVRIWHDSACVLDMDAHRSRRDAGVWHASFVPSAWGGVRPSLVSAGADGVVKVYAAN